MIKYKNIKIYFHKILNVLFSKLALTKPLLFADNMIVAPIAQCNYRCLFCEILQDDVLYGRNRYKNELTLEDIKNLTCFFSRTASISFYGGYEEPLMNRNMSKIIKFLKDEYSLKLNIVTNGSLLTQEIADTMVKYQFDSIYLSYHAFTEESYKKYMTGNMKNVDRNIEYLQNLKFSKKIKYPFITMGFAPNKHNRVDFELSIQKALDLGVDELCVNNYHGARNQLEKEDSYDYDPIAGNLILDRIYKKARDSNINIIPTNPMYWLDNSNLLQKWDDNDVDTDSFCFHPWRDFNLYPHPGKKDTLFVCVCNRLMLMEINYKEFDNLDKMYKKIWHHPLLQYMRATTNHTKNINPICKYCKNRGHKYLRNLDIEEHNKRKDKAIIAFFTDFREKYKFDAISGLEILSENPFSYNAYSEQLKNRMNDH